MLRLLPAVSSQSWAEPTQLSAPARHRPRAVGPPAVRRAVGWPRKGGYGSLHQARTPG